MNINNKSVYSTFKISNHADSLENVDISNKDDRSFSHDHVTFSSNLTRCTWFTVCMKESCVLNNYGILAKIGFMAIIFRLYS